MTHKQIVLAGLAALAVLTVLTGTVLAAQPDNYCTTVTVEATASGYEVAATGAGRYARIQDLTAATTVVATDFGAGATAYTWTGLALNQSHNYQVQVSHTSISTGYSTSGCLFVPPEPQGLTIDRFEIVAGVFEWDATEDGAGYWVTFGGKYVTAWTAGQSPGNVGFFSYSVAPIPTMSRLPFGTYYLWAQDASGQTGIAATYVYARR